MLRKNGYILRFSFAVLFFLISGTISVVEAIRIETSDSEGNLSLGLNVFMSADYAYMSEMPMVLEASDGTQSIGSGAEVSSLDLGHLNLLFSIEKSQYRALVNLHSADGGGHTNNEEGQSLQIQEAYGEYIVNQQLRFRAGDFLAPFGLYNDVSYILSLISSTVLPQMYQPPLNYRKPMVGGQSGDVLEALTPHQGNLMLWGERLGTESDLRYFLYLSDGAVVATGSGRDRDLGVVGRLLVHVGGQAKFGASFYTEHTKNSDGGRRRTYGGDVVVTSVPGLKIQMEYLEDHYRNKKTRTTGYLMLSMPRGLYEPYVVYDFLRDPEHLLMKRKQVRYSSGLGYHFSSNILLKAEYHYHVIMDDEGLSNKQKRFEMVRLSVIMIF